MTRPVFGVDPVPPASTERMAYIARGACGHIVALAVDNRPGALTDFALGATGLVLDRIPLDDAQAEGACPCPKPDQLTLEDR